MSLTRKEAEELHAMDEVGRKLWFDLRFAREALERLRRRIVSAERAVEARSRELATFKVTGVVPRRKGVADVARESMSYALSRAGAHKGKGGTA